MFVPVHPAETTFQGDGRGYNPRAFDLTPLPGTYELIAGVFRDDGVGSTNRPDRPFRIIIPTDFQGWHSLNTKVFYALQSGAPQICIRIG